LRTKSQEILFSSKKRRQYFLTLLKLFKLTIQSCVKKIKKYIFIKKYPYLIVLIVTLALITTGYVLTVILSGNQSQISKYGEGGEINHLNFI